MAKQLKKVVKACLVSTVHIPPLEEWVKALPLDVDVLIVDDSNGKIKIESPRIKMFDYAEQESEMGELYPYFAKHFHKSSACKNFGLWYAYKHKYDYVGVIDSDCIVSPGFLSKHVEFLVNNKGWGWENTMLGMPDFPRGFPYEERQRDIALNLGLWGGLMDINGKDRNKKNSQLDYFTKQMSWRPDIQKVAVGVLPLSGMNFCIKREAIPALMFLPNFGDFRRHDDIMGGYVFQKIVRMVGDCVTYGYPLVYHASPVDAKKDTKEEEAMVKYGMDFYERVDKALARAYAVGDYKKMFKQFSEEIEFELLGTMFEPLIESIKWFVKAYE